MALQCEIAGKALAPGFVRLQILEVHPAQIEHEVDQAVRAGHVLDKLQRLGSALLGLLTVDDAAGAVQHGPHER